MGWVPFIVAVARLIFSIWVPKRKGKLAQVKRVMNSLLLSKPQETQKAPLSSTQNLTIISGTGSRAWNEANLSVIG